MNLFKPRPRVFLESVIKCIKAKQKLENSRSFQVDGCIVGNGSQDFTQSYTSYSLNINGSKARLIDIPGIEGKEEKFVEIIKEALQKAHLVCYVARESKGLEETTLTKVKDYMQKNITEMIGIHNIPLQPQKEYDGDDYVDDITKKVELGNRKNSNIGEQLKKAVPEGLYRDTVGISALPGLCSLAIHNDQTSFASPEKFCKNLAVAESLKTLRRQQTTFLSRASDIDLFKVSRLSKLRNAIIDSCTDAPKRIKKAALIRLSSLLQDEYLAGISKQKQTIGEFRNKVVKRTDSFVSSLDNAKFQMKRNMANAVKNAVFDFFRQDILEAIIYPHIESYAKIEESILNSRLKSKESELNKKLLSDVQDAINSSIKDFVDRVKNYTLEYQNGLMKDIQNISVELPEFSADSFDFKGLGDFALKIGGYALSGFTIGSVIPGIGSVVGTIVGTVVGAIVWFVGLFTSRASKIQKCKNSARQQIEDCAENTWYKMSGKVDSYANQVSSKVDECISFAKKQAESSNKTYELISSLESKIKSQVRSLENEITLIGV